MFRKFSKEVYYIYALDIPIVINPQILCHSNHLTCIKLHVFFNLLQMLVFKEYDHHIASAEGHTKESKFCKPCVSVLSIWVCFTWKCAISTIILWILLKKLRSDVQGILVFFFYLYDFLVHVTNDTCHKIT